MSLNALPQANTETQPITCQLPSDPDLGELSQSPHQPCEIHARERKLHVLERWSNLLVTELGLTLCTRLLPLLVRAMCLSMDICKPSFVAFKDRMEASRVESESDSRLVTSDSLQPHELYSPWNSPVQNAGVGSRCLLQGLFPTQGSNAGLLHCRRILYQLSHKGNRGVKAY